MIQLTMRRHVKQVFAFQTDLDSGHESKARSRVHASPWLGAPQDVARIARAAKRHARSDDSACIIFAAEASWSTGSFPMGAGSG